MAVPVLETQRLILRPRGIGDLDAIMAMSADPEVMRYLTGPGDDVAAFRARTIERVSRDEGPGLGAWSLFAREAPDEFLGWVSLNPMPEAPDDIELDYRMLRAAWGRGLMREAAAAALAHGFATVGLAEIVAIVHPENLRSQAVVGRLGFVPDGERPHAGGPWRFYRLARPA